MAGSTGKMRKVRKVHKVRRERKTHKPDCGRRPLVVDILDPEGNVRCSGCRLYAAVYVSTGNLAIQAVCPDGEPWGTLTVNPGYPIPDDRICIKDYSEGAGNLKTLEAAGLVETPPVHLEPSGFVMLPICRLTEKGKAFAAPAYKKRRKT